MVGRDACEYSSKMRIILGYCHLVLLLDHSKKGQFGSIRKRFCVKNKQF